MKRSGAAHKCNKKKRIALLTETLDYLLQVSLKQWQEPDPGSSSVDVFVLGESLDYCWGQEANPVNGKTGPQEESLAKHAW